MLTITPRQMAQIEASVSERYVQTLVVHAQGFAPRLCEVAGSAAVHEAAALAMRRALALGWSEQHLVRFYLDLGMTLGCDFGSDPQYPWAAPNLQASAIESPHTLACRLHDEFVAYSTAVTGPDGENVQDALRRLVAEGPGNLPADGTDVAASLWATLNRIYPQKAARCGGTAVQRVAVAARREAEAHGLPADAGTWILGALMLVFGVGVCRDPLYPWVAATLAGPHVEGQQSRVRRLWRKAVTYADHAARYLAQA